MNKKQRILIDLLRSLSKKELKSFNDFLQSPYHKIEKGLFNLFQALKKEVLSNNNIFDSSIKAKVYHALIEEKQNTPKLLSQKEDGHLRAKMTLLTKAVEQFFVLEALKEKTALKKHLLNSKLLEKENYQYFKTLENRKSQQLKKAESIQDFEAHFKFALDKMNYLNQQGLLIKEDNFFELHHYLDMYYLANKLNFFGTMHSIQTVYTNKNYPFIGQDAVNELLKIPSYAESPLIHLSVICAKLMQTNQEGIYFILRQLLNRYDKLISKTDLIGFYHVALNSLIGQVRRKGISPYQEIFLLFKEMEDKNSLMEDSFVDLQKLKNAISVSCRLGEFKWAEEIIEKYHHLIEDKDKRNSVQQLNLGIIEFYKKNYSTAIGHLGNVKKVGLTYYEIAAKRLLVKSYYEIDSTYDYGTIRIIKSISIFISKQKQLSTQDRKAHKNFMELLGNIYCIRHKRGKMTIRKVETKMTKMEYISDAQWLKEKIKELQA